MIIDIKVDIDWLREDGSIDDTIREAVVSGVINTVKKDVAAQIETRAAEEINQRVDVLIDSLWTDFMEKRVTITDKYGDPVESHDTIKDMLKARLDRFLNERVDSSGKVVKTTPCPYNAKPKLDWLIDSRIEAYTKDFVQKTQADFDVRLKGALNEKLKASLSASMLKNIDLGKLIQEK